MHFVCIDRRTKKPNGSTNVILSNGQEILLPPSITRVPALLLLNKGHSVIFGEDINNHINPQYTAQQQQANVVASGEPEAYMFGNESAFGCGVSSDSYSFLDQDSESLSAKGNGGMRQQRHYASIDQSDSISTPPDNYEADTIGNITMDQLQQQRATDIPK